MTKRALLFAVALAAGTVASASADVHRITASSITSSANNTASTSWAVTFPAASAGDLLIVNLSWDDSTTTVDVAAPAGPNSEAASVIQGPGVSNGTAVRGKTWFYKATGNWSAGNLTFTPTASEQWTAHVIKIVSGGFDATVPIGSSNTLASASTSNPACPSLTAGASDGGGLVVCFIASDTDDADGTVAGWTVISSVDSGAAGKDLITRDALATNSENISSASGWTYPLAREWVSFGYIVRPFIEPPPPVTTRTGGFL